MLLATAPPRPVTDGDATEATAAEPTLAAAVARATKLIGAAQAANPIALLPGDVVVDARSIAVLPFTPDGDTRGPQDSSLAARLQRDLTAALAAIPGVYAIDAVSASAYAGADLAPAAIGAQLGARAIMTGQVAGADGRIRIAAVLRDATTNAILWRHDYDDALTALSAIQVDIVDAVTTALVYAPRYGATVAALERTR
jgi:TolB-like protein